MLKAFAFMFAGSVAAIASLEVIFQLLPTSTATMTGYHVDQRIVTYAPHHEFVASFGWNLSDAHHHRTNNFGFLTSRDFTADESAVALIGDSFVDGSVLREAERLGPQLELRLDRRPVYAMGSPGSSLLDYAERMRLASERFGIRDFVLLIEQGDVRQALCGSGNVQGPCIDAGTLEPRIETLSFASGAVRDVLRRSALAQYVFSQLKFDLRRTIARITRPNRSLPAPSRAASEISGLQATAVIDAFFAAAEPLSSGTLVLIFDCDHARLNRLEPASDPIRDTFMTVARARGAKVVDVEALFRDHLARGGLRLEVSPTDAHWNSEANRIAAEAAAAALQAPQSRAGTI